MIEFDVQERSPEGEDSNNSHSDKQLNHQYGIHLQIERNTMSHIFYKYFTKTECIFQEHLIMVHIMCVHEVAPHTLRINTLLMFVSSQLNSVSLSPSL